MSETVILVMYVTVGTHARRVPSHGLSCLVLAVLTTRLTDSVDHPLAKNTLAVATFVITVAGTTQDKHTQLTVIGSRSRSSLCLLTLRIGQQYGVAICIHLERTWNLAAWRICRQGGAAFPGTYHSCHQNTRILQEGTASQVGRSLPQHRMHFLT